MKFFKALISWKLWFSILLGIVVLVGLWFFTFGYLDNYTRHGVEVEVPNLSGLSVTEAEKILEENDLRYEIDSVKFTENFAPYAIIDFYPKAGSKVKPGRRIFIKSNPHNWAPVPLPSVINASYRLAGTKLSMRGFVIGDTIYVKDPARDAVLAVLNEGDTIQAGQLLPKGSFVDLVLGMGLNVDVPVPDLLGLTLLEAEEKIRNLYFDIGQIYYLDSKDSSTVRVVYQDPPRRDIYDEGLPISLWLSSKSRSENRRVIDSLNIVFRQSISGDSAYIRSIENSESMDLSKLPEEIRNQVKNDQQQKRRNNPPEEPKPTPRNPTKIDRTGISID